MLTAEECRHFLSLYDSALTSRIDGHRVKNASKDLLELDSWRLKELAKAVRERSPSYMRKDELEKLMDCKLSRGKFRPRLKQFISSNGDADVLSSSERAFTELATPSTPSSILIAVKTLSELKGVGPATATMVLQAKSDAVPFMSDEAMLQVFSGDKLKLKYDIKTCGIFIEKIYEIVNSLENEFSAADVERALYAKEVISAKEGGTPSKRPSDSISPSSTKKRQESKRSSVGKEKLDIAEKSNKRSESTSKRDSIRKKQT